MSEIQLLEFMQSNRILFVLWFMVGTLMPIGVIFAAYMFRNFEVRIRGAAMVSALIGVVMLALFSTQTQNVFFSQLTSLSQMAAAGSEVAKNAMTAVGLPIGQTISPPGWMVGLSIVQVLINLVLTVYLFVIAKWKD
jgi:hypothetical protein